MPQDVNLYEGQLGTSQAKVYTAPDNNAVRVTSIAMTNITGTAATVRIDRVPVGGTDSTSDETINQSIPANSTVTIVGGNVLSLAAGDMLWASAGTATAIDVTISGTEDAN
jgi:hypothetical protein